ncbi:hypothetical protein EMCRGX_G023187 [Ephydatia muelleri]
MLYPFLSAMTKFFLPGIDTALVNRYAGVIVGAFFMGRIFGRQGGLFLWGSLADHFGRKPILIVSATLMAICSFILAFSVSYVMTVAFRVVLGFCSGVFVVSRAVISESSSNANHTFGFSVLTCSWLLSAVIAPLFSGLSADPITQYNLTLPDGTLKLFLTNFPYSPPFLLNTLVCIAGVLAVIFLLPETLDKVKKRRLQNLGSESVSPDVHEVNEPESTASHTANLQSATRHEENSIPVPVPNLRSTDSQEQSSHASSEDINSASTKCKHEFEMEDLVENVEMVSTNYSAENYSVRCLRALIGVHTGARRWFADVKFILFNKVTLLVFLTHCLFAVVDTGFDAIYSLWCAAPLYLGGIDFTVREIGITSTVVGALFLPFSLFVYPLLEKKYGSIQSFQMSAILNLFLAVTLPNIHYLAVIGPNSVTHDKLGRANGLAVLMSDIFRAISPALTGTIYAASLSERTMSIGFPGSDLLFKDLFQAFWRQKAPNFLNITDMPLNCKSHCLDEWAFVTH